MIACTDEPTSTRKALIPDSGRTLVAPNLVRDADPGRWTVLLKDAQVPRAQLIATADEIARSVGGRRSRVWGAMNGFGITHLPDSAVEALRRDPRVRLVAPVFRNVSSQSVQQLPSTGIFGPEFGPLWALDRIDHFGGPAYDLQFNYEKDGTGVHIYIVDTGIRGSHAEFAGRIGTGSCHISYFLGYSPGCSSTIDVDGHGTAVASAAAGATYGVAKGATIHSVRIKQDGGGDPWDMVDGLMWILEHLQRPAVVNVSQGTAPGTGGLGHFLWRALMQVLVSADVVVVNSAGNDNADAASVGVNNLFGNILVGNIDRDDSRDSFSNWGTAVTIMAPGAGRLAGKDSDTAFEVGLNGTSFAAPRVAGVAATVLQAFPAWSAATVRQAIIDNASQTPVSNGNGVPNRVLFSNFISSSLPQPVLPPPMPSISVSIDGYSSVRPSVGCYYFANAYGGAGSYTYTWIVNGQVVGDSDVLYFGSSSNFLLELAVSDGTLTGFAKKNVTVSSGAGECYAY